MNLERANVVVRPRDLLELHDLSFRFLADINRRLVLRYAFSLLTPAWLLCLLLYWYWQWPPLVVWLAALLLAGLCQGPFTALVGKLMFETHPEIRGVVRQTLRLAPRQVIAFVLSRLAMSLGAVLIVPAGYSWVKTAFINEAIFLEGLPSTGALKRSARFTRGQAWEVLQLLLSCSTGTLALVLIAEVACRGIVHGWLMLDVELGALERDGISAWSLLGLFLSVPWLSTVRFLSYIDARTRRDGWDIQIQLLSLNTAERADAA